MEELLYQIAIQTLRLASHKSLSSSDMPVVDLAVTVSSHKAKEHRFVITNPKTEDDTLKQPLKQPLKQLLKQPLSLAHTQAHSQAHKAAHKRMRTQLSTPNQPHTRKKDTHFPGGGRGIAAVASSVRHHIDHDGGRGPSPEEDEGGGKRGERAQQKGCESQSEREHLLPCASTHTMPPPLVVALALPPSRSPPYTPPS